MKVVYNILIRKYYTWYTSTITEKKHSFKHNTISEQVMALFHVKVFFCFSTYSWQVCSEHWHNCVKTPKVVMQNFSIQDAQKEKKKKKNHVSFVSKVTLKVQTVFQAAPSEQTSHSGCDTRDRFSHNWTVLPRVQNEDWKKKFKTHNCRMSQCCSPKEEHMDSN